MRNSIAVLVLAIISTACTGGQTAGGGDGSKSPTSAAGEVRVTEKDFSISVSPTSLPAGEVTFDIHNEGPSPHEFVVIRTDLPEAELPTVNGAVEEDAEGVEVLDEVEDVTSDASETLVVNLEPGSYVLICNLPGHYLSGMHTALTVT